MTAAARLERTAAALTLYVNGRLLDLLDPDPAVVDRHHLARTLARLPRWAGQIDGSAARHYSVAEHSCHVETLVHLAGGSPSLRLWALLHDAPEALGLNDIAGPLKRDLWLQVTESTFRSVEEIERGLMAIVAAHFGLQGDLVPAEVKAADRAMQNAEAHMLLRGDVSSWAGPFDPGALAASLLRRAPCRQPFEAAELWLARLARVADHAG